MGAQIVVPTNSHQSSSQLDPVFEVNGGRNTFCSRGTGQVSEEDGRQEPSTCQPQSQWTSSPLGETVSENLETRAADIVFIPDPRFAALKLHGAEFPW